MPECRGDATAKFVNVPWWVDMHRSGCTSCDVWASHRVEQGLQLLLKLLDLGSGCGYIRLTLLRGCLASAPTGAVGAAPVLLPGSMVRLLLGVDRSTRMVAKGGTPA